MKKMHTIIGYGYRVIDLLASEKPLFPPLSFERSPPFGRALARSHALECYRLQVSSVMKHRSATNLFRYFLYILAYLSFLPPAQK